MKNDRVCPRCGGQLLMQDELTDLGWEKVPSCLQCSYQVFVRSTEQAVAVRRQPVLPSRGR